MESVGCVHVYTGTGKGKTTAALGLMLRAAGAGLSVLLVQFLKRAEYSEHEALKLLGDRVTVRTFGGERRIGAPATDEDRKLAREGLASRDGARVRTYDLVVADEIVVAAPSGCCSGGILALLDVRPLGRTCAHGALRLGGLMERADLVTEMKEIRHYFAKGVPARRGIENDTSAHCDRRDQQRFRKDDLYGRADLRATFARDDRQPFKRGRTTSTPAFTPGLGRPCRNLDTMLLSRDGTLELFDRNSSGADLSVVEGVMGLFDGAGARDERGSTAHLAKMLKAPVLLVVNGRSMARSAAALVLGFSKFDRRVAVAGVLLNALGSANHYRILKEAIEGDTGIPVFGYLPRTADIAVPERHLGLVPSVEHEQGAEMIERIRLLIEEHVDVKGLLELARRAPLLPSYSPAIFAPPATPRGARIAVARDEAFHFYYQDNLDILEHLGATLLPFSPLRDPKLPEGTQGVYIGGGFPEEFAEKLSANESLRAELRAAADRGMPLRGVRRLMYLVERLEDKSGTAHRMAGVFPGVTRMGKRLQAPGTAEGRSNAARCRKEGRAASRASLPLVHLRQRRERRALLPPAGKTGVYRDGLAKKNAFASYLHLHFGTNLAPARRFLERAAKFTGRLRRWTPRRHGNLSENLRLFPEKRHTVRSSRSGERTPLYCVTARRGRSAPVRPRSAAYP